MICNNPRCNKEFTLSYNRSGEPKFCSRRCAGQVTAARCRPPRDRETRICAVCSQKYSPTPGNVKHGNPRFCSTACKHEGRRLGLIAGKKPFARILKICKNPDCRNLVFQKYDTGYCSRKCYAVDAVRISRATRHHHRPTIACEHCGNVFVVPREHNNSKGKPRRFCSNSCKWAARQAKEWLCIICHRVVSKGAVRCSACRARPAAEPRRCRDCGMVIVEPWARRCQQCRELWEVAKGARRRAKTNADRYLNIHIGRELLTLFPELRTVVANGLDGYSGEQRRNKRKDMLAKIGAEGAKMFNLKERAIQ